MNLSWQHCCDPRRRRHSIALEYPTTRMHQSARNRSAPGRQGRGHHSHRHECACLARLPLLRPGTGPNTPLRNRRLLISCRCPTSRGSLAASSLNVDPCSWAWRICSTACCSYSVNGSVVAIVCLQPHDLSPRPKKRAILVSDTIDLKRAPLPCPWPPVSWGWPA